MLVCVLLPCVRCAIVFMRACLALLVPPLVSSPPRSSYRSAALRWHPDRYVDRVGEQELAAAKFILIAEGQAAEAERG